MNMNAIIDSPWFIYFSVALSKYCFFLVFDNIQQKSLSLHTIDVYENNEILK